MKLAGQKIQGQYVEDIYIPRGIDGGEGVLFKAKAVNDLSRFEELCPEPIPRMITRPGEAPVPDIANPQYKERLRKHSEKRLAFMILESLSATEGLEWEAVKLDEPDTWLNYTQELKEAGFSQVEINLIIAGVMRVNSLDEEHIRAARERFLALKTLQVADQSSQQEEQDSTPSGEAVNA